MFQVNTKQFSPLVKAIGDVDDILGKFCNSVKLFFGGKYR